MRPEAVRNVGSRGAEIGLVRQIRPAQLGDITREADL
jgi:hypothetical protein